ncbi:MAG: GNAT family N-acetyltransferase [Polyangiaceae bacterium]|nr:GNAT family N-acetyltransferase [Polyangiaceae bacterium]
MKIRFELVGPGQIGPHVADLRALERGVTYPLGGGERFFIDHGEAYHPFFSRMGDASFLLALEGERVVGALAGVFKRARCGKESYEGVYLCDLKLAPGHRGQGVARGMLWHALSLSIRSPELRRWRFAYGATMRGERGDVMRSARGVHAARMARPWARLKIWFARPEALASLDAAGCPPFPGAPLDLSPDAIPPDALHADLGLVSTAGRKDLRLVSSGAPWPLVHLAANPGVRGRWGAYLREAGEALVRLQPDALACFALDERLSPQLRWIEGQGLTTDASCTVYALRLPGGPPRAPFVHLATSEI